MNPLPKRLISLTLLFITGACAYAQTEVAITTLEGNGADVYIQNNTQNLDTRSLVVKNAAREPDDPHLTRKTYLRFDLSSIADRLNDIEAAELSIMTSTNHVGGSATPPSAFPVAVDGLSDESLDGWIENEVVWNDAPANILINNELDPEKTVTLGTMEVPEIADPDLVSFSSSALIDFIKTDTNGVITLILRRTDTDAAYNLSFYSKETSEGVDLEGVVPTLTLTIGGELVAMTFEEAISGIDSGFGVVESPWFGRLRKFPDDLYQTHLGWIRGNGKYLPESIWLPNYTLGTWIWMSESTYPWIYSAADGWTYVLESGDSDVYLHNYQRDEWTNHNDFGWTYPRTEEELMERLTTNIISSPRPKILLSEDVIPELREKLTQGWMLDAYKQVKFNCELILRQSVSAESMSATIGRRIHDTIVQLAFVGHMEDSQRHFDYAVDYAILNLDTYTLDQLRLNNAGSPHLGTGDVLHAYGIAYDWLYPYLNLQERVKIKSFLEELGTIQYDVTTNDWTGNSIFADSTNHNSVAHGGLGMAALALGNKPEWIEQALNQNSRYLQYSTDATGWNFEGRGYWNYGAWGALPFCEAIYHLGGPDVIAGIPKLKNVAVDFFLRQMPPYDYAYGTDSTSILNARFNDEVGHWAWLQLQGDGPTGDSSWGNSGVDFSVYTLLLANPDLGTTHPRDADLPLDKLFENGRATFRDSWEEDAAVLTYSTGWAIHSGHRMRSESSFKFYALEEEFSISPEDAQTRIASMHSMVMVDDRRNTRDAGEYPYGSEVLEYRSEADYGYIRGDAKNSAAYFIDANGWLSPTEQKVSEATRQILFVRSPTGIREPYVVIVDDLTTRAETSKFSWLFQTRSDNTVDFGEMNDGDFTVTGSNKGAILDVDFIAPAGLTNEMVTHTGFVESKKRMDENEIAAYLQTPAAVINGKSVRFIAILRAHEGDKNAPVYSFEGTDMDGTLTVNLSDGSTDVIKIKDDNMTFERIGL